MRFLLSVGIRRVVILRLVDLKQKDGRSPQTHNSDSADRSRQKKIEVRSTQDMKLRISSESDRPDVTSRRVDSEAVMAMVMSSADRRQRLDESVQ